MLHLGGRRCALCRHGHRRFRCGHSLGLYGISSKGHRKKILKKVEAIKAGRRLPVPAAVVEQPCRLGLVASTCHTSQSTLAAGAKQRVPARDAEGRVLLDLQLGVAYGYAYPHRM